MRGVDSSSSSDVATGTNGITTVADNAVRSSGFRGIFVNKTFSCRVSENVVHASGQDTSEQKGWGIQLSSEAASCLVQDNTSSGNTRSGLRIIGNYNHIVNNVLNQNGEFGLFFDFADPTEEDPSPTRPMQNTFGGNTARGNGTINPGATCDQQTPKGPCTGLCLPDYCDEGVGTTSFGTNLAPGPPPS